MRITSVHTAWRTVVHIIVWGFACMSVLVLPWWVPAMCVVYGVIRARCEALIPALLLDAVYAPVLPVYGVYLPHTAIVALLLYMSIYVRRRLLPA
jgi:hypothetical protein